MRYRVFAGLAATALLFRWEPGIFLHLWRWGNVTWSGWLPVALAFGVLARPGDLRWLLAMYAGVFVDVFVIAPEVPNHYVLTAVVGATVWTTALAGRSALGRWPTGDELVADLAGPLRTGVAVFYLFTGVWKSNWGFVEPATSCGALSWARLEHQFPVLPDGDGVRYAVMAFTLLLEYLGPVLLLVPATRAPMAAFFVVFHGVLGLDILQNYQNFSWAMVPVLGLFLPDDAWDRLVARWPVAASVGRSAAWGMWVLQALLLLVAWFSWVHVQTFTVQPFTVVRWFAAVACLWAWFVVFCAAVWVSRASRLSAPGGRAAWIGLALIVLNGTSPIVGWKNRNAWQMYSNVRIEAGASNHWFLPASFDVFGLQRDTVRIVDTTDLELRRTTIEPGLDLTWWDFRVWLADNPHTRVTYERAGKRYVVQRPEDRPAPPPLLLRKVVWFRPVGEAVARQCVW